MPLGTQPVHPGQVSHARRATALVLRDQLEPIAFVLAPDESHRVDAPRLALAEGEAQLRERNSHLDRPAIFINRHVGLPDGVPAPVVPGVIEEDRIRLHVRRTDPEHHSGQVIVHRIEIERDAIGIAVAVAGGQPAAEMDRVVIEHTHTDVQSAVVVEDADFCAFSGWPTFVRIDLREIRHRLRLGPDLLVELSVDGWRVCRAGGAKLTDRSLTLRLRWTRDAERTDN